jgi:hypothetical protein
MEILDIEWERCLDGYKLVDPVRLDPKEEKYFAARPWIDRSYWDSPMIARNSHRMERYHPLENVLFAVFAKWEASPEGMVRFCNAYGPLIGSDYINWMLDEQRILQFTLERLRRATRSNSLNSSVGVTTADAPSPCSRPRWGH